jgi:hypothetical protein
LAIGAREVDHQEAGAGVGQMAAIPERYRITAFA